MYINLRYSYSGPIVYHIINYHFVPLLPRCVNILIVRGSFIWRNVERVEILFLRRVSRTGQRNKSSDPGFV